MTEDEAIELHISENLHRISVIEEFLRTNTNRDDEDCRKNIQVLTKINGVLQEIQGYKAIGTVEECQKAMERQNPKKPAKDKHNHDCCPNCGWIVYKSEYGGRYLNCCENCGQAVDWPG